MLWALSPGVSHFELAPLLYKIAISISWFVPFHVELFHFWFPNEYNEVLAPPMSTLSSSSMVYGQGQRSIIDWWNALFRLLEPREDLSQFLSVCLSVPLGGVSCCAFHGHRLWKLFFLCSIRSCTRRLLRSATRILEIKLQPLRTLLLCGSGGFHLFANEGEWTRYKCSILWDEI